MDHIFDDVPLGSVKRAAFILKNGTFSTMAKMIFNGKTYDFGKTAENGAVVLGGDYSSWQFVSPDGRLDYASYDSMTIKEMMDSIIATIQTEPIPAWDNFAVWLNTMLEDMGEVTSNVHRCFLMPVEATSIDDAIEVNPPSFSSMTSFVSFIEQLGHIIEPALDQPAIDYKADEKAFVCALEMTELDDEGVEQERLTMAFMFRE